MPRRPPLSYATPRAKEPWRPGVVFWACVALAALLFCYLVFIFVARPWDALEAPP